MAIVACRECKNQVSTGAKFCPHCGVRSPSGPNAITILKWIVMVPIVLSLGMCVYTCTRVLTLPLETTNTTSRKANPLANDNSPVQTQAIDEAGKAKKEARDNAVKFASMAVQEIKKHMRNPDSFVLEQAALMTDTNAVCVTYRAQNGFGGMNRGQAVIDPKMRVKTNDMYGFESMWKKNCKNDNGEDIAAQL